jgi:hypothetical protein
MMIPPHGRARRENKMRAFYAILYRLSSQNNTGSYHHSRDYAIIAYSGDCTDERRTTLGKIMTGDLGTEIIASVRHALEEDIGPGDATTDGIVPRQAMAHGRIIAKQDGVVAGLDVARTAYALVDRRVSFRSRRRGRSIVQRQVLADISGARALLTAERTR